MRNRDIITPIMSRVDINDKSSYNVNKWFTKHEQKIYKR